MEAHSSHAHHHVHSHAHSHTSSGKLFITFLMNMMISAVQVSGGLVSGSLSLISDALHNLSDAIAIVLTWIALKMSHAAESEDYTFGLKRAEILAAVINTVVLVLISCLLFKEAFVRFFHPKPISGTIMIVVAAVGLVANVICTVVLKEGSEKNINIRSAYLHLLTDAVTSAGVILGGVFIVCFNVYWVDPVLTVLIALYIIKESWHILRQSVIILMMGKPENINLKRLKTEVEAINGVVNIHHTHIWMLTENLIHFEAHVDVACMTVSETETLAEKIEHVLEERFDINHVTLQFETSRCESKELVGKKLTVDS